MGRDVQRCVLPAVWVAACLALALGCGKKGKAGPPPLTEQEQARAIACADAVVAVGASAGRAPRLSSAHGLARACADACGGFADIASGGKSLTGLGATCDPGCPGAGGVSRTPAATYWHRFASACGAARYGVDGHPELLTADWFVMQRSREYLRRVADRARGQAKARVQAALASTAVPRPNLPGHVEGRYAAPSSRVGRETDRGWVVAVGQTPGTSRVGRWPTGEVIDGAVRVVAVEWAVVPTAPATVPNVGIPAGETPLIVAASAHAPLIDLGTVVSGLGAARLGVALPRGVLGEHPVGLVAHAGDLPSNERTVIIEGDAVYVAKRKVARGTRGHDWATVRTLLTAAPAGSALAVQLRAGATAVHLTRLLDMAQAMGRATVAIVPSHVVVPTGVAEVPADAVRVDLGAASVATGLHAGQVTPVLDKARPGLRACYAAQLAAKPKLSGTAVARIQVAPGGTVASVAVRGVDQSVSSCAARLLRGLQFPAPRHGAVKLRVPISFTRATK